MKKLLTIAITLACLSVKSQNCFGIYDIKADTSTVGDSSWVGIATRSIGSLTDTLFLQINFGCSKLPYIAKPTIGQFKTYKKYYHVVNDSTHNFHTDSLTKIEFKMNTPCVFGIATYYLGFPNPGNCALPNTNTVFIKDSTHVSTGGNTGIAIQYEKKDVVSIEYYDLTGRSLGITKPETPGIYIQMFRFKDLTYKLRKILI